MIFVIGLGRTDTLDPNALRKNNRPFQTYVMGAIKIEVTMGIRWFVIKRGSYGTIMYFNQYVKERNFLERKIKGELDGRMKSITKCYKRMQVG